MDVDGLASSFWLFFLCNRDVVLLELRLWRTLSVTTLVCDVLGLKMLDFTSVLNRWMWMGLRFLFGCFSCVVEMWSRFLAKPSPVLLS